MDHIDLVFMSDTHELHRGVDSVPPGDVFIHCGDWTMLSKSEAAILDFNRWLGELPHRHKILTCGNHESFLAIDPRKRTMISNAILLIDEGVEVLGLKLWCSPVTPLRSAAFGVPSRADRVRHWSRLPADTDVLVTHGPPYSILDSSEDQPHAGDLELLEAVLRTTPLIHAFGHVHGGYGMTTMEGTTFINCALLGQNGDLSQKPIVLRLPHNDGRSSR